MATEACGGGTPDLGFFLGVTGFIGELGVGIKSGGLPRGPQARGTRPRGAPPRLVAASGLLSGIFLLLYFLYFPKIFSENFYSVWTPFDIPFLRSSKTRKNINWH